MVEPNDALARCELCGEPMPEGEQMFKFHGYSGPCPKPPLPKKMVAISREAMRDRIAADPDITDNSASSTTLPAPAEVSVKVELLQRATFYLQGVAYSGKGNAALAEKCFDELRAILASHAKGSEGK